MLWISHILVRHKGCEASHPPFGPIGWSVQPPAPNREAAEAAKLAEQIANEARQDPSRFAELARTFSEDVTTRERGGALGGVPADQLLDQPGVLDALASLQPGEVSRVVKTDYGYHILLRQQVPDPVQLAGRHIVIGHDSTSWLQFHQREGKKANRTRAQALALAEELSARARAKPDLFARLVAVYSEHGDALDGGDIGVWSNRERASSPRMIDALANLQIGQISLPVETPLGFEVIERTPVENRQAFAVSVIRLRFNPGADDSDAHSKATIGTLVKSVLMTLRKDPTQFVQFQQQYCCSQVERWTQGRASPELTRVVRDLAIGAIASEAVLTGYNYCIVKRLDPDEQPIAEAHTTFELPAPATADLEYLVTHTEGRALAKRTREVARTTEASLRLSAEQETEFENLHEKLAKEFESKPPDDRVRTFHDFHKDLERLLGAEKFEIYRNARDTRIIKMLVPN